jgi:hypothetical protein
MPKRWMGLTVFVALVAAVAVVAWWLTHPGSGDSTAPVAAPAVGSCWDVSEQTVATAYPWPGRPVACSVRHTAEVYHVGRAADDLIARLRRVRGSDARVIQTLMDAQARRACVVLASSYLGGDWHATRVEVVADWIRPASRGHYGCALVEAPAPASKRLVARTAGLRGALAGGGGGLAAGCVTRDGTARVYSACDAPHDGEFVGSYTITPPDAPFDRQKVTEAATHGCDLLLTRYVGASRTELRAAYVGPTAARDWLGSDQTFACYGMATGTAPLTRSIKDLGAAALR